MNIGKSNESIVLEVYKNPFFKNLLKSEKIDL